MQNNYTNLVEAIRKFCVLVEELERYPCLLWLREIEFLLGKIDRAMSRLDLKIELRFFTLPDLEYRFRMFCRLKDFLGGLDNYPLPGDQAADPDDHTGSLADDITDIYYELRRGLNLWEADSDPLSAVVLWHTGYVLHWQTHLVDARRHIRALRFERS